MSWSTRMLILLAGLALPAAQPSAAPGCVLIPVYPPHFRFLRRLLASVREFATDDAPVHVLFDHARDASSFTQYVENMFPELGELYSPLLFEDIIAARGDNFSAVAPLGTNRTRTPTNCFDWVRVYQALKKLLGVAHLRGQCEAVWVMDAESMALSCFSFRRIFADVLARPSIWVERKVDNCANRLLRTLRAVDASHRGKYNVHGDWWVWRPAIVHDIVSAAIPAANAGFVEVFTHSPCPANSLVSGWIDSHLSRYLDYTRYTLPSAWDDVSTGGECATHARRLGPEVGVALAPHAARASGGARVRSAERRLQARLAAPEMAVLGDGGGRLASAAGIQLLPPGLPAAQPTRTGEGQPPPDRPEQRQAESRAGLAQREPEGGLPRTGTGAPLGGAGVGARRSEPGVPVFSPPKRRREERRWQPPPPGGPRLTALAGGVQAKPARQKMPKGLSKFLGRFPIFVGAQAGWDGACLASRMQQLGPIHAFSSAVLRELLSIPNVGFVRNFTCALPVRWCVSNCPPSMRRDMMRLCPQWRTGSCNSRRREWYARHNATVPKACAQLEFAEGLKATGDESRRKQGGAKAHAELRTACKEAVARVLGKASAPAPSENRTTPLGPANTTSAAANSSLGDMPGVATNHSDALPSDAQRSSSTPLAHQGASPEARRMVNSTGARAPTSGGHSQATEADADEPVAALTKQAMPGFALVPGLDGVAAGRTIASSSAAAGNSSLSNGTE